MPNPFRRSFVGALVGPALAAALLSIPALPAQGLAEVEPNDQWFAATPVPLGQQAHGRLLAGEADWFRVTLPQVADLRLWTAPGHGVQAGDTTLALYDGFGLLVASVDDGRPASHGKYSFLERGAVPAGTWFVRVAGATAAIAGSYTLDVAALGPGVFVPDLGPLVVGGEGNEPNDPRRPGGVPVAATNHAELHGAIAAGAGGVTFTHPTADYDVYRFVLPGPGVFDLQTSAGSGTAASDTVLHLCDGNLVRLAYDDDGGPGFHAWLRYAVPAAGVYHVAVSDYATGNYRLDAVFTPPAQGRTATVAIQAGGCGPFGGVPTLRTRSTDRQPVVRVELPILGTEFWLDVANLPPGAALTRVSGLLPRTPFLELAAYGAPGCRLEVEPVGVDFGVADAAGVHFWGKPLPADLALDGLPLEQQVIVLDPTVNALGIRMTNRTTAVAGVSP